MGAGDVSDQAWRGSHHGAVYAVLAALLDSSAGRPAPGTEGVIGRAQAHFRRTGDRDASARLDTISVILFRLIHARWAGDAAFVEDASARLDALARDWLLDAPIFPGAPSTYAFDLAA